MQDINGLFKPLHEFSIASSKALECLCLLLKNVDDGVGRFAIDELVNDWMSYQVGPCSLLEFVQGRFKERLQLWRGIVRHGVERDGTGL